MLMRYHIRHRPGPLGHGGVAAVAAAVAAASLHGTQIISSDHHHEDFGMAESATHMRHCLRRRQQLSGRSDWAHRSSGGWRGVNLDLDECSEGRWPEAGCQARRSTQWSPVNGSLRGSCANPNHPWVCCFFFESNRVILSGP